MKRCRTIDLLGKNGLFTGGCFFENIKNVYNVDLTNDDRVQRVRCVSCHTGLGFRYVRVPAAQLCFLVQNGRFNIKMDRVSYWNTNQVLNGYSEVLPEPIPTPEPVFHLVPEPFLPSSYIDQLQAVAGNLAVLAPQPQPPDPPQGNGDEPPYLYFLLWRMLMMKNPQTPESAHDLLIGHLEI